MVDIIKFTPEDNIEDTRAEQGEIKETTANTILDLLGDPEKIVDGWRNLWSQEHFTEEEQHQILEELKKVAKFWEDKIEDPMDPQDDGVWNNAWCENIIRTWEKSCKEGKPQLLPINNGINRRHWNEIFEGYAVKRK